MAVKIFVVNMLFSRHTTPIILLIGIACGFVLFFYNPVDIEWMPRCPFFALTGLKCPGCGTLRAIHNLLQLKLADAWNMNPFLILSMPLLCILVLKPELCKNFIISVVIVVTTILYWIGRNIFAW